MADLYLATISAELDELKARFADLCSQELEVQKDCVMMRMLRDKFDSPEEVERVLGAVEGHAGKEDGLEIAFKKKQVQKKDRMIVPLNEAPRLLGMTLIQFNKLSKQLDVNKNNELDFAELLLFFFKDELLEERKTRLAEEGKDDPVPEDQEANRLLMEFFHLPVSLLGEKLAESVDDYRTRYSNTKAKIAELEGSTKLNKDIELKPLKREMEAILKERDLHESSIQNSITSKWKKILATKKKARAAASTNFGK